MSNLKGKSAAFATFPLQLQLQLVFLKVFIAIYVVIAATKQLENFYDAINITFSVFCFILRRLLWITGIP